VFDNALRNFVSRTLKIGRGKDQINKKLVKFISSLQVFSFITASVFSKNLFVNGSLAFLLL